MVAGMTLSGVHRGWQPFGAVHKTVPRPRHIDNKRRQGNQVENQQFTVIGAVQPQVEMEATATTSSRPSSPSKAVFTLLDGQRNSVAIDPVFYPQPCVQAEIRLIVGDQRDI